MDAVIHSNGVTGFAAETQGATEPTLVAEGYLGFNVVRHGDKWYGFDQATGEIDIASLDESALEQMKGSGMCVVGVSYTDVKTEILRVVIQAR
jgi:hypothetical protein